MDLRSTTKLSVLAWVFLLGLPILNSQEVGSTFQQVVDTYHSENNIPGVSASVMLKGGPRWDGVSGFSHGSTPMDTSLYVGIASNTKLFTSILSLKMIENGFYDLEDPISKWLDPIAHVNPNITVKQLLQHNGGVNDFIGNTDLFPSLVLNDPSRIWSPEETLTYLFEPIAGVGEGVFYSNANYVLAAMVMEAATGILYEDLLRDSIFSPLGLDDIFLEGFEEVPGELAHPFLFGADYFDTERTALGTITWSAGCLVSKPRSLTTWYDLVFGEEHFSNFVMEQVTDFIDWPDDADGKKMGLGLYLHNINDREYYGHGGNTIGYASYTLYDIECGHSISVVINELFADALSLAVDLAEKACELSNMETSTYEEGKEAVLILPNPAREKFSVSGAHELTLYSVSGRRVRHSGGSQMLTHDLTDGIYILHGINSEGPFVEKILVSN